jgi:hypothetical protein
MNTEAIMSSQLVKNAKSVLSVGQKQWKEALTLYKTHGKQIVDDGKAFYQDLWELQVESVGEIKKAIKGNEESAPKRSGASKKDTPAKED